MKVGWGHDLSSVFFVKIFKSGFGQFLARTPFEMLEFVKVLVTNSTVEPSSLIENVIVTGIVQPLSMLVTAL